MSEHIDGELLLVSRSLIRQLRLRLWKYNPCASNRMVSKLKIN